MKRIGKTLSSKLYLVVGSLLIMGVVVVVYQIKRGAPDTSLVPNFESSPKDQRTPNFLEKVSGSVTQNARNPKATAPLSIV
jgi:hypothetical protein